MNKTLVQEMAQQARTIAERYRWESHHGRAVSGGPDTFVPSYQWYEDVATALESQPDRGAIVEISETELKMAVTVFTQEWAKLYSVPPHHPSLPLAHAIEAILRIRAIANPKDGE